MRVPILLMVMLVAGCATSSRLPVIQPASEIDRAEADLPFVCASAEHCALSWRKAQVWISQAASTKIQLATDTLIQTYGTSYSLPGWAFTATRIPGRDGRDTIALSSSCVGKRCNENPVAVEASFKRYLRAAD